MRSDRKYEELQKLQRRTDFHSPVFAKPLHTPAKTVTLRDADSSTAGGEKSGNIRNTVLMSADEAKRMLRRFTRPGCVPILVETVLRSMRSKCRDAGPLILHYSTIRPTCPSSCRHEESHDPTPGYQSAAGTRLAFKLAQHKANILARPQVRATLPPPPIRYRFP